jgi:hypothetical protein
VARRVLPALIGAAVIGTFLPMASAHAVGSCGSATPFVGTAAGTLPTGASDWWETPSLGTTTVTVVGTDDWTLLEVYDADCTERLCAYYGPTTTCTVGYTGLLKIGVTAWGANPTTYTMTETTGPGSSSQCNVGGLPVCIGVSTGTPIQSVDVALPEVTPAGSVHVVGAVDTYRFTLPTGGSILVPCVVLEVDATTANACAAAGGAFVSRTATLVDDTVDQPTPGIGVPIHSVGICPAELTVTVAGFGVEDFPAYALC